jgi:hypothetical protein
VQFQLMAMSTSSPAHYSGRLWPICVPRKNSALPNPIFWLNQVTIETVI